MLNRIEKDLSGHIGERKSYKDRGVDSGLEKKDIKPMSQDNNSQEPPKRLFGDFGGLSRPKQALSILIALAGVWLFPPLIFIYVVMAIYYRIKYPSK